MKEAKQKKLLTLYSVGHFAVDMCCAFVMISLSAYSADDFGLAFLVYNFCAFAMQMPMGLIADKLDRNASVAVSGLIFTLISFAFSGIPVLCALILGMGNCLYHVGGGVDVLHFSDKKQWMLGVYVSVGAVGLFLGSLIASSELVSLPIGFAVFLAVFLIVWLGLQFTYPLTAPSGNPSVSLPAIHSKMIIASILLFFVVVLRSYAALTMSFPWKQGALSVISVLGLASGKAAGGFLADKIGALRSSFITLSLSGLLFVFSEHAVCGISAVFLFNMTMPLTLFALSRIFPKARGFSFGVLTFALFIGYIPDYLGISLPFDGGLVYAAEAIISLILLAGGLIFGKEKGISDEI